MSNNISDEQLIMNLKFDETSGTVAADTSPFGSNNVGELRNGAEFVQEGGDFGGVVRFDGKNDYIHINDAQELNIVAQAKRTVSVWFKVENQDLSTRKQVIYEEGGSGTGLNIYLHAGKLYIGGWIINSGWQTYLSTTEVASNTWHHVAVVLNADPVSNSLQPGVFKGYLDGHEFAAGEGLRLNGRSDDVGIGAVNQNTVFHDGAGKLSGSHALAGNLEDLRVYNRVLTQEEISSLYEEKIHPGEPTPPPPPTEVSPEEFIMQLKFDETSGIVAADTSPFGSNNVGELRNGAAFVEAGGDFGGVVSFDGKDDYIHINDAQELNIVAQAKRTVSVWFKVENKDISTRKQVIYEEGGSTTGINIYVHGGSVYVGGWNTGKGWQTYLSSNKIANETWHHVAVVVDTDLGADWVQAGKFRGYLDGDEFAAGGGLELGGGGRSDDVGIGALNQNTKFHDGAGIFSGSHAFAGNLEDLRVYNRVLSEAEIGLLYNETTPPEPTPPPLPTEVSPEEFVMQLKFDETSGTVAADTSPFGSNNVGELRNGAAFVEAGGDFGGVVRFDGKDDYIHVNDAEELNISTQAVRTVSAWFKVENKDISTRKQVIYEEGGSTTGINIYVHGGKLYVGGWNTAKGWQTYLSSNKIANETWHHVAVVVDTDLGADWVQAGTFRGYLDGDEFAAGGGLELGGGGRSDDVGIGALNQNTKFHDGAGIFSGSHAFAGNLEDLRVYNRVLSEAEIGLLYNETTPPAPTPPPPVDPSSDLVMQLKFDETSGITAGDSSPYGQNNSGQLRNGTQLVQVGGNFGGVVALDGYNDYIQVENSADINTATKQDQTISLWFGVENVNDRQVIYEQGSSTRGLNIYLENGKLYLGGWDSNKSWETYLSTPNVSANTWHHLALVLDTVLGADWVQNGAFRGYLDGHEFAAGGGLELVGNNGAIGIGAVNGNTKFQNGNQGSTGSDPFHGSLEDFRVYNRALTATEITDLFNEKTLPTEVPIIKPAPQPTNIGTNLNGIADWSSELPFLDGFKSSRTWITQNQNTWNTQEQGLLELDENGWVKHIPAPEDSPEYTFVGTVLLNGLGYDSDRNGTHDYFYPGGKYVVLYEGEGVIEYSYDAQKDQAASTLGRDVINVNPSNKGIWLKITSTDPNSTGNYIRNIKFVPEAYETAYANGAIFNPDFIEKIDDFNAIRFMDWMRTNNSPISELSDRPTLDSSTWNGLGAPLEIMVELANETGNDPWFNIPHMATDEYITWFADYVHNNLDPELNVYVEYSNEVWNPDFQQHHWVKAQAGNPNFNGNFVDWFSKRTTEITQIWDQEFGADKDRVIGVMGAQAANLWIGQEALKYNWDSTVKTHEQYGIDAIAIAPYFGGYLGDPENEAQVQNWTLDQLFDEITQGGILANGPAGGTLALAYNRMQGYANLAREEGLDLIAYEGGQHLVGRYSTADNQAITNLFIQANRDPRMQGIYEEYFTTWHQLGGGLFQHFGDIGTPSKYGSWGALEHVYQDNSPKYDALMGLLNGN